MENRKRERQERGRTAPKIIATAQIVNEHRDAVSYDLLTRTNFTIDDLGHSLSWGVLFSFIKYLDADSALVRDMRAADLNGWNDTIKTNVLLADVYDLMQVLNANLVAFASRGKTKPKITPYPRPGAADKNTKRIGKGALPYNELREWIKRRQTNGKR